MSYIEETIIKEFKNYIEEGNLNMVRYKYEDYKLNTEFEYKIQWDYIFCKTYIHACLKKHPDISSWLKENIFDKFGDVQKIAIKHTINYGNFLLRK